jgi:hypothetical protein
MLSAVVARYCWNIGIMDGRKVAISTGEMIQDLWYYHRLWNTIPITRRFGGKRRL